MSIEARNYFVEYVSILLDQKIAKGKIENPFLRLDTAGEQRRVPSLLKITSKYLLEEVDLTDIDGVPGNIQLTLKREAKSFTNWTQASSSWNPAVVEEHCQEILKAYGQEVSFWERVKGVTAKEKFLGHMFDQLLLAIAKEKGTEGTEKEEEEIDIAVIEERAEAGREASRIKADYEYVGLGTLLPNSNAPITKSAQLDGLLVEVEKVVPHVTATALKIREVVEKTLITVAAIFKHPATKVILACVSAYYTYKVIVFVKAFIFASWIPHLVTPIVKYVPVRVINAATLFYDWKYTIFFTSLFASFCVPRNSVPGKIFYAIRYTALIPLKITFLPLTYAYKVMKTSVVISNIATNQLAAKQEASELYRRTLLLERARNYWINQVPNYIEDALQPAVTNSAGEDDEKGISGLD